MEVLEGPPPTKKRKTTSKECRTGLPTSEVMIIRCKDVVLSLPRKLHSSATLANN